MVILADKYKLDLLNVSRNRCRCCSKRCRDRGQYAYLVAQMLELEMMI